MIREDAVPSPGTFLHLCSHVVFVREIGDVVAIKDFPDLKLTVHLQICCDVMVPLGSSAARKIPRLLEYFLLHLIYNFLSYEKMRKEFCILNVRFNIFVEFI